MHPTFYLALIIITGVVLLIVSLSWARHFKKKEREKNLLKQLDEVVKKHQLSIDKKQTLNRNLIALDRANGILVFIDHQLPEGRVIELHELKSCRLKKERNHKGHIAQIHLICDFKDDTKADVILPFYDERSDRLFKMMRLSKKAAYWQKTIMLFKAMAALQLRA
jgi:competence protein ComGF